MLDSIPAWVTALVLVIVTVAVIGVLGVLFAKAIGRRLAAGFASVIGKVLLSVVDGEIEQKTANLELLKSAEKEAFAMVETLRAFELDETVPLKLRKVVAALRIGQLKHRYEQAIVSMEYTQVRLRAAREEYSLHGAGYTNQHAEKVKRLVADLDDQESRITGLEQLLDRYGVEYEKLVHPKLAIVE